MSQKRYSFFCKKSHSFLMIFYRVHDIFSPGIYTKRYPGSDILSIKKITNILNRITCFHLTDSFCGFKAYKVEKLKLLHLTEYGYGMPLQLWMQAWKERLRIKEIPVKLIYKDLTKRFHGILGNPDIRLEYYKNILRKELSDIRHHKSTGSKFLKVTKY